MDTFALTNLDDLALDKILTFLEDEDFRAFHQVSHAWKAALEKRSIFNNRRVELVRKIRENKENLKSRLQEEHGPAGNRVNTDGTKPGSLLLVDCQNLMQEVPKLTPSQDNMSENLTPNSRFPFQNFEEVERSLKKSQKLFQCRRCRGPVASPIFPLSEAEDNLEGKTSKNKIEATRCRLISRMGLLTPESSEEVRDRENRKRSKTPQDISTLTPRSVGIPTTQALGDRMSTSLVISGLTSTPKPPAIEKDNHNCKDLSSVSPGIDLHTSRLTQNSSIDYQLNFSNASFGSPFSIIRWQDSLQSISESPLGDSANSDRELSQNSMFRNLILTPGAVLPCTISKSSIMSPDPQDLLQTNTLDSSNLDCKDNLELDSQNHDITDIEQLNNNSHNINDIKNSHEPSSLAIEVDKGTPGVGQNLDPSLLKYLHSKSSSGYFSGSGSILREDIYSFFPEFSSGRLELLRKSDADSSICRSRSLGNVIEMNDENQISFESSASCPNLNESFVLQCPNPNCSYRFCSTCFMGEHPGKPCRLIDSESFESFHESIDQPLSISQVCNKKKGEGKGKGQSKGGTGKIHSTKKKSKLLRIARL